VISIADNGFTKFKKSVKDYQEGEILVKFKDTVSDYSIMSIVEVMGDKTIKKAGIPVYRLVKLGQGKEVEQAVAEYQLMSDVEYAQPNYIYRITSTVPNDTYYANLWALKNTEQTISDPSYNTNNPGTLGMDMDMELAWDHVTDCSSIIVAIIDSGVNYNHLDLADNMWNGAVNHGYDFVDSDNDPMDLDGHGTHVAGTIGAVGNNNTGTTGVCWDVQIMAVRVMNALGWGTTADIISGIYYAVDNEAQVLNMSFGGYYYDQAEYDAIEYAKNNNVIVIAAAGNDAWDNDTELHHYPSDFDLDNIISVSALDQSYELADFSSYGSTSVDVGAPGTNIQSEWCGTESVLNESLTSGWTEGGTLGWAHVVRDLGYGNENLLADPSNWGMGGTYISSANDKIWKTFNLSGFDVAVLNYAAYVDVETGYDFFAIYCDNGTLDPFINGLQLDWLTGSTDPYFYYFSYEIPSNYSTSTSTIGFTLVSDSIIQWNGVGIVDFNISTISLDNTSYLTINGTSMAAPHVSGLAALIWAFNPEYTYKEVIESVKNGGESVSSLNNKTTTGKAVNALGSFKYIKPPVGVSISKN
jgi:subtilisin family serine protease